MPEQSLIADIIKSLGVSGLVVWVVYKLVDKWAAQFLAANVQQATALGDLASAVKSGQGEQKELLLAVRVVATKIDETMGLAREINKNCLARRGEQCPMT